MVLLLLFFFDQQFQDPNCEIALANWLKTEINWNSNIILLDEGRSVKC